MLLGSIGLTNVSILTLFLTAQKPERRSVPCYGSNYLVLVADLLSVSYSFNFRVITSLSELNTPLLHHDHLFRQN